MFEFEIHSAGYNCHIWRRRCVVLVVPHKSASYNGWLTRKAKTRLALTTLSFYTGTKFTFYLLREGQFALNLGHDENYVAFQGVPGIYLLLLCDVIKQMDLDDSIIIQGMGITRNDLLKPDSKITMGMGHLAAQRATAIAGDLGLGMAYARALKVTLHGSVGIVALTSPTMGSALHAMSRFIGLRAPFFEAGFTTTETHIVVSLIPTMNIDGPILTFMTEAILIGVVIMAEQLLGQKLSETWVEMTGPEPPYYKHYKALLPAPVKYNCSQCCLRGPIDLFHAVPQLADPAAAELARQQCEQEYAQLFPENETLGDKIARHLKLIPTGSALPNQDEIARRFNISTRTLKRRLQETNVSFRDLMEHELKSRAKQLLRVSDLDISEIAYQLGYNDVGNFSTAFKRWTNETPRAFRQKHK